MADEGDVVESDSLSSVSVPGEPAGVAPIAGIWRRVLAFAIDCILLGVLGQVLGWSLASVLFEIGPYGRVIGAAIALCYFGVMGSVFARGSTLGKRALGLSVRDSNGHPIGLARSVVRTSVWLIPATLNGWALPILANPIVARVATVLVFGVGGAVFVTMLFNRRTRQGVHDLVTQTYVLRMNESAVAALPAPGKLPWILSATMLLLAVVLANVGGALISRAVPQLHDLTTLQQRLQEEDRFFAVTAFDNTFHGSDGTRSRTLRVQVWCKGVPTETERVRVMNDVARVALRIENPEKFDLIRVEVLSAYDLGIASGSVNHGDGQPVSVWKQRVERGGHTVAP